MLSAIDVPKSKSVTIAFMGFKSLVLGLLMTISFNETKGQYCSDAIIQLIPVYRVFYIIQILSDLVLMFVFMCSSKFDRLMYYVLFSAHLILTVFSVIVAITQASGDNDCSLKAIFIAAALVLRIDFLVSAIIVMWCNLYFGLKFAHFACNIVWTFLWLQSLRCNNVFVAIIGVTHGFLSVTGLVCFVVLNFMRKNKFTALCWRQLYAISIFLMIFCYIVSFIGESSSTNCQGSKFFMLTYQKYGIFQMIGAFLLLCFMSTQMGDPRDRIVHSSVKIFDRSRENENFIIDDTN